MQGFAFGAAPFEYGGMPGMFPGQNDRAAPRWHIDAAALSVLEASFAVEPFPNSESRKQLGFLLSVSPRQIQVWFQNRRQRDRKRRESGDLTAPLHKPNQQSDKRSGLPLAPVPAAAKSIFPLKATGSLFGPDDATPGTVPAYPDSSEGTRAAAAPLQSCVT